jgi:NMD protein affecting ribosome stability and mRNA decay
MDEGRNMILLFPTLIEGINTKKAREVFKPTCHMFYSQRVVDFPNDNVVKWDGLDNQSNLLDDDGNVLVKYEEGMSGEDMDNKKRKALDFDKEDRVKQVKEAKV